MTAQLVDHAIAAARRCGFGICREPAEQQVLVQRADGTLEHAGDVCDRHVKPTVEWGRPAPLEVALRPI